MDLTRLDDRRPAIEARVRAAMKLDYIGQVSKVGVHNARTVDLSLRKIHPSQLGLHCVIRDSVARPPC